MNGDRPPVSAINWGDFNTLLPLGGEQRMGELRIDEYYVQRFIEEWAGDLSGDMAIGHEVLSAAPGTKDCVVLPHVLHQQYRLRETLWACARCLRPGGMLLATFPAASLPERADVPDFWRLTASAAKKLIAEFFPPQQVTVRSYGNVLTNLSLLHGITSARLTPEELDHSDPYFPVVVGICARQLGEREKADVWQPRRSAIGSRGSDADARQRSQSAVHPKIDWGDLGRLTPVSDIWGIDRGGPVDRVYIERFLETHANDIRGHVIEVKDANYTRHFGGSRVERVDILDLDESNAAATIQADLSTRSGALPADRFDCFVLTQTLHIIYDVRSVLSNAYRMLKPGGVLLCTAPCISRVSYEDGGLDEGDFWRFTPAALRDLASEVFPADGVHVEIFGNLASSGAFMLGLSPADVPADKLSPVDAKHPLICGLRAVKPLEDARRPNLVVQSKARSDPGAVLLYHRIGARQPDTHDLATDLPSFRNHLAYLRDRCVPMPLEELAAGAVASRLPRGAVALTFDDGYLEHLTVVAPLLAEYGVPATFFVTTDRLDESHESWWDTLERVFASTVPLPGRLDLYGDGSFVRATASADERAAVHRELGRILYRESADRRADALRRIVEWSEIVDLAPRQTHRLLTADEITLLARMPGCDVGAHSVNHLCLSLQPPSTQADEVGSCKVTLERLLGTPIRTFAYPYGGLTETTALIVRDAGFSIGATVSCGAVSAGTPALEMPRLEVGGFNAPSVVGRLEMCFDS